MKKKIIIAICAVVVLGGLLAAWLLIFKDKPEDEPKNQILSDAEKFSQEYTQLSADNVFVYRDIDEIINILENGTGVVYLGFPECKWCQKYVTYLNEIAKNNNITTIYYYDILEDRADNTEDYQKIVSILEDYLQFDEEGNKRIYVPIVIAINNGEIIDIDDETSYDTLGFDEPDEYWTEEEVADLKDKLNNMFEQIDLGICTDCNK